MKKSFYNVFIHYLHRYNAEMIRRKDMLHYIYVCYSVNGSILYIETYLLNKTT